MPGIVGEFFRIGSASLKAIGLIKPPITRPIINLGGRKSPNAISIPIEQCATICAALILPHCRSLSGRNRPSRAFTSSTVTA